MARFDHTVLRFEPLNLTDKAKFVELYANPVVLKHISDECLTGAAEHTFDQHFHSTKQIAPHYFWRIASEQDTFMGLLGINCNRDQPQQGEFGMMLFPKWYGAGIGTYALDKLMCIGFEQLALQRLYASYRKANTEIHKVVNKIGLIVSGPRTDSQGIVLYDCEMDRTRFKQLHR